MREDLLNQFYQVLEQLRVAQGGYKFLIDPVPLEFQAPGVYFFLQEGITRQNLAQLRVIRVGKSRVAQRLNCHRGNALNGGGYHRSSVFRKHVGKAIISQDAIDHNFDFWEVNRGLPHDVLNQELPMEIMVSNYIRPLPYIYLPLNDLHLQNLIERRSIELLSNYGQGEAIDVPPMAWLGYSYPGHHIPAAHLWNVHYVQRFQPGNAARYHQLIDVLNAIV